MILRVRVGIRITGRVTKTGIALKIQNDITTCYSGTDTDDNGNAMFQSYLSKLFKKETG